MTPEDIARDIGDKELNAQNAHRAFFADELEELATDYLRLLAAERSVREPEPEPKRTEFDLSLYPNSTPGRIKKELADLRAENQRKGELIQELTTNMGFLSDSILAHDAELVRLRDSEGRLRIGLDAGIDGIEFAIAYFGRTEGSIAQRLNDRLTSARAALSQPEPPAAPKVQG